MVREPDDYDRTSDGDRPPMTMPWLAPALFAVGLAVALVLYALGWV